MTGPTEHQIQCAVIELAGRYVGRYPELALLHAIPNGGHRNIVVATGLRREGVRPGVPDLCLPVPSSGCHGLYVEMKRPGGYPTPAQREWLSALDRLGYATAVCRDPESTVNLILRYLRGEWQREAA